MRCAAIRMITERDGAKLEIQETQQRVYIVGACQLVINQRAVMLCTAQIRPFRGCSPSSSSTSPRPIARPIARTTARTTSSANPLSVVLYTVNQTE